MIKHILRPQVIEAAGSKPKLIEEFIGVVNSSNPELSIARMKSPQGWEEPGQKPEFDEFTVILEGRLNVETRNGIIEAGKGEAIHVSAGEWIRYSTPHPGGAEYISVCLPAFTVGTVHRDK